MRFSLPTLLKKGDSTSCDSYRGISVLFSPIAKSFKWKHSIEAKRIILALH